MPTKHWCRHIRWEATIADPMWVFHAGFKQGYAGQVVNVTRGWKCCPICKQARP